MCHPIFQWHMRVGWYKVDWWFHQMRPFSKNLAASDWKLPSAEGSCERGASTFPFNFPPPSHSTQPQPSSSVVFPNFGLLQLVNYGPECLSPILRGWRRSSQSWADVIVSDFSVQEFLRIRNLTGSPPYTGINLFRIRVQFAGYDSQRYFNNV